jgi:hypothetical protein
VIKDLPPDMLEELNDHTFVVKEGWRLILATKPPNQEEILESWYRLKELKSNEETNS